LIEKPFIKSRNSMKIFTEMILDRAFHVSKHHHWKTELQVSGKVYLVVLDHVVEGVVQLV